jgi:hypothetical protein
MNYYIGEEANKNSNLRESIMNQPHEELEKRSSKPVFSADDIEIYMPKTEDAWKILLSMLPTIKLKINKQPITEKEQKKINDADSQEDD